MTTGAETLGAARSSVGYTPATGDADMPRLNVHFYAENGEGVGDGINLPPRAALDLARQLVSTAMLAMPNYTDGGYS